MCSHSVVGDTTLTTRLPCLSKKRRRRFRFGSRLAPSSPSCPSTPSPCSTGSWRRPRSKRSSSTRASGPVSISGRLKFCAGSRPRSEGWSRCSSTNTSPPSREATVTAWNRPVSRTSRPTAAKLVRNTTRTSPARRVSRNMFSGCSAGTPPKKCVYPAGQSRYPSGGLFP